MWDEYQTALKELADWLSSYRRVAYSPKSISSPISTIIRQSERNIGKLNDKDKLTLMYRIDEALSKLLDPEDIPPMEIVPDLGEKHKAFILCTTEPKRYREIIELGPYALFRKQDREFVGKEFDRQVKSVEPFRSLHKALKLVATEIAEFKGTLPDPYLNLYIAIREVSSGVPELVGLRGPAYKLNHLFSRANHDESPEEQAEHYVYRLNKVATELAMIALERTVQLRWDDTIKDAEEAVETYVRSLRFTYVRLRYYRVRSVV